MMTLSRYMAIAVMSLVFLGADYSWARSQYYYEESLAAGVGASQEAGKKLVSQGRFPHQNGVYSLVYRLFFAGVDIGGASIEAAFLPGQKYYMMARGSSSASESFLKKFFQWDYEAHAWGQYDDEGRIIPLAYRMDVEFGGEKNFVLGLYENGQLSRFHTSNSLDLSKLRLTKDQQAMLLSQGGASLSPWAIDPAAFLLRFLSHLSLEGYCDRFGDDLFVFDGPVRLGIDGVDSQLLEAKHFSPYEGEVLRCRFLGAGVWLSSREFKDSFAKQRASNQLIASFLPSDSLFSFIPARVVFRSGIGSLKVYLVSDEWILGETSQMMSADEWQEGAQEIISQVLRCSSGKGRSEDLESYSSPSDSAQQKDGC